MIVRGPEKVDLVGIDDRLDRELKPGVYLQTVAFFGEDNSVACTLADHVRNCRVYDRIVGYPEGGSIGVLS